MINNKIRIDSSVAMMQKLESNVHAYDYVSDYDNLNWNIADGIYEIPVGAVKNRLVKRIIHGDNYKSLHSAGFTSKHRNMKYTLMEMLKRFNKKNYTGDIID